MPFVQLPGSQGEHHRGDLGLVRLELDSVEPEEDGHDHEGDALVAVVERVPGREAVAVGRRQLGEVGLGPVGSALPWPSEGRLKRVLVAQAGHAAMLTYEVELHGLRDQAVDPARLSMRRRHRLLGQLA